MAMGRVEHARILMMRIGARRTVCSIRSIGPSREWHVGSASHAALGHAAAICVVTAEPGYAPLVAARARFFATIDGACSGSAQ